MLSTKNISAVVSTDLDTGFDKNQFSTTRTRHTIWHHHRCGERWPCAEQSWCGHLLPVNFSCVNSIVGERRWTALVSEPQTNNPHQR